MRKSVGRAIDVALILCLCLTGWRLLAPSNLFATKAADTSTTPLEPGAYLQLPGVNWSVSEKHVVLFLDNACPACGQSTEFYASLSALAAKMKVRPRLIALTPRPRSVVADWLAANKIAVDQIVEFKKPSALGLYQLPTVLLVDSSGRISDIAARKLSPEQERLIEARMDDRGTPYNNVEPMVRIDEIGLSRLAMSGKRQLVDVRQRKEFALGHRADVLNIPLDELSTRAPMELDSALPVVVDCFNADLVSCRIAGEVLKNHRFADVRFLMRK